MARPTTVGKHAGAEQTVAGTLGGYMTSMHVREVFHEVTVAYLIEKYLRHGTTQQIPAHWCWRERTTRWGRRLECHGQCGVLREY